LKKPQITTLIPTYRRPQLLQRAIATVLRQTFSAFTVRVFDNGSNDETENVVAEIASRDPRVQYHRHPENIGMYPNFAFAMSTVETPFFNLLSDDDGVLPGFYQLAIEGFQEHQDAMAFMGLTIDCDPEGRPLGSAMRAWREGYFAPPHGAMAMLLHGHPEWTSVMFRREVLESVGGLDVDVGLAADLDFELRVALRHPVVASTKPCAVFVGHPWSTSNKVVGAEFGRGIVRIAEKFRNDDSLDAPSRRDIVMASRMSLGRRLFIAALGALRRGDLEGVVALSVLLETQFSMPRRARWLVRMAEGRVSGFVASGILELAATLRPIVLTRLNSIRYRDWSAALREFPALQPNTGQLE
jgi:glycosyltransferase involved in cell wall biosynthesis